MATPAPVPPSSSPLPSTPPSSSVSSSRPAAPSSSSSSSRVSIPAVLRVAADAGELDPEALAQLNEDPAQAEKKSKKYEMKLKDLRNKYKDLCTRGETTAVALRSSVAQVRLLQRELAWLKERKVCWVAVYRTRALEDPGRAVVYRPPAKKGTAAAGAEHNRAGQPVKRSRGDAAGGGAAAGAGEGEGGPSKSRAKRDRASTSAAAGGGGGGGGGGAGSSSASKRAKR